MMSRWIQGYQDVDMLSDCLLHATDAESLPFMGWLKQGRLPQFARIESRVVPILGLMEILAASRLLADTDVLGGGGKNAGFVIERNIHEAPVAVRMVKIDAGESFNFTAECNHFAQGFNPLSSNHQLRDFKDLQYGNNQPVAIQWTSLTQQQRQAFLSALKRGWVFLAKPTVTNFIVRRRGLFDKAVDTEGTGRVLLNQSLVNTFLQGWAKYRNAQTKPQVYGALIAGVSLVPLTTHKHVPFTPKAYGAVSHQTAEAEFLAQQKDDVTHM